MTPEAFNLLLDELGTAETDRVERTVSTDKTDKFAQAICAFANDFPRYGLPGYLLIGLDDKTGQPCGLTVTDQLLQNLAALRSDGNIQPLPAITVDSVSLPAGAVAIVKVLPADMPPVRYKGRIWIRVGPRKAIATEQEERILTERRASILQHFDGRPCVGCDLPQLSLDLFRFNYLPEAVDSQVIKQNNRSIEQQLASLRFYDLKHNCATYAGIILFGNNPLYWLPGGYIQFIYLDGDDLEHNVLAEREISGDLLTILRQLDEIIKIYNQKKPVSATPLRERTEIAYPPTALREFLMNAVMHRDYSSTAPIRFYWFAHHIEIQNPGGLYGEATPDNFPRQNAYRNPVIAEAMKTLGYVNKYGSGVIRAQAALRNNGQPDAVFTFEATHLLVTLKSAI